jgi:hypothetical protein
MAKNTWGGQDGPQAQAARSAATGRRIALNNFVREWRRNLVGMSAKHSTLDG